MDSGLIWLVLGLGAMFAGFVDAIAGGGGLIQIPTLMGVFPGEPLARIFGTNKVASVVGTAGAGVQYAWRVPVVWSLVLPGAVAAATGAWLGAHSVSAVDPALLRPLIVILLLAVAAYIYRRKDFGQDQSSQSRPGALWMTLFIGAGVGFYDGFFGPGTGSFFVFLLVRWVGLGFLQALATAKILNVATNLSAIGAFSFGSSIMWGVGAWMAICNLAGALLGSRLALKGGASFVRKVFLLSVLLLVGKLVFDLFFNSFALGR